MTVYDYTIGFNYDPDTLIETVFVKEADSGKQVDFILIKNVDNRLKAFLHYTEYCDYLTDLGEYWFYDAIGVLSETYNAYVPVKIGKLYNWIFPVPSQD